MMASLPADSVAQMSGLSGALHTQWVQKGILTGARYGSCTEAQAFEAAVASALKPHVKRLVLLRAAMDQARPKIEGIRDRLPKRLDLVWMPKRRRVTWVQDSSQLAEVVRIGTPVVVLPLAQTLAQIREAFKQEVAGRTDSLAAHPCPEEDGHFRVDGLLSSEQRRGSRLISRL
jgi:hypothetical protein